MVRLWRVLHLGAWLSFDSLHAELLDSRPREYAANLEVVPVGGWSALAQVRPGSIL